MQVLYFDGGVYYNKMKKLTTWHESLQKVCMRRTARHRATRGIRLIPLCEPLSLRNFGVHTNDTLPLPAVRMHPV